MYSWFSGNKMLQSQQIVRGCCRCKLMIGHRNKEGSLLLKRYIQSTNVILRRSLLNPIHIYNTAGAYPISFRDPYLYTIESSQFCKKENVIYLQHSKGLSTSSCFKAESKKPSSKVEETTEAIKEKAKEVSEKKPDVSTSIVAPQKSSVVVKKSLWQRVKDELHHYYHGFKLLFIDIRVSSSLVWKVLKGGTLTRREYNLLIRTVGDMFRLVPFSIFIIVPFMELLLPVFIKLFPGMLPSTFQTAKDKDAKMKQSLKVKLEMAKFLQQTLDEMAVTGKGHSSQAAKDFIEFFHKVRTEGGGLASNEEILKFSKLFEDELTLDSLTRSQLMALCRVLELQPFGTTNLLRFQLRMKLRSLAADDLRIKKEGVASLTQAELQQACRLRGMRALGMSEERLRAQLTQWLDLSLSEKVPPSLLLLSRAFMLPESITTTEKLVATISALPDTVATKTKAVIGEREGKVDNKTKIELIKEEVAKIQEEKKEIEEEAKIKYELLHLGSQDSYVGNIEGIGRIYQQTFVDAYSRVAFAKLYTEKTAITAAALLNDRVTEKLDEEIVDKAPILVDKAKILADKPKDEKDLSAQDIGETLEDVLDAVGKDKKKMIIEKEELDDLKEEMKDYQEDVQNLKEVTKLATDKELEVKESKAAKRLSRTVNKMILKMDRALSELEKKELAKKETLQKDESHISSDELLKVDELIEAIQKLQKVPDASCLDTIKEVLGKIDIDKDGVVKVDDLLKVLEVIGRENIKLTQKQIDEVVDLLKKEDEVFEDGDTEEKMGSSKGLNTAAAGSKVNEAVDNVKVSISKEVEDLASKTTAAVEKKANGVESTSKKL